MALIRSLVLAALFAAGFAAAESDTTLLLNGKILTVDSKFSTAEALAIRDGGRVIAFARADQNVPNEAKRLLKTKGRAFVLASKAKRSLKIKHLSLQSQEVIEK